MNERGIVRHDEFYTNKYALLWPRACSRVLQFLGLGSNHEANHFLTTSPSARPSSEQQSANAFALIEKGRRGGAADETAEVPRKRRNHATGSEKAASIPDCAPRRTSPPPRPPAPTNPLHRRWPKQPSAQPRSRQAHSTTSTEQATARFQTTRNTYHLLPPRLELAKLTLRGPKAKRGRLRTRPQGWMAAGPDQTSPRGEQESAQPQ